MRGVAVELGDRAYEVRIGSGIIAELAPWVRSIVGDDATRAFLVADTGVPVAITGRVERGLGDSGFAVSIARVTPSEEVKSIETFGRLLAELARSGHTRRDPLVALGGGVVGDLAGFAAASYQRGIDVIQCPTTLLSMVDASVGGKTGVNLRVDGDGAESALLKNLVGAFHQPRLVVAEIDSLESLAPRHRRAGLAECVKHGMISGGLDTPRIGRGGSGSLLGWMGERIGEIAAFDPAVIEELVAWNVAIKAGIVSGDERESIDAKAGGRMLLNFGHTFGHAIETLGGLSFVASPAPGAAPERFEELEHGEAVALGMVAACRAAVAMGRCDESIPRELIALLGALGLPVMAAGLPPTGELIERMRLDKKTSGGALRVILPVSRGECAIVSDPDRGAIAAGLDAIRA